MGELWVDRNEEFREWIVELAGEEPAVQDGEEGFGNLLGRINKLT